MPFKLRRIKKNEVILWVLILIPYLLLIPAALWYFHKLENIANASFIIINKAEMTLSLYSYKGELIQKSGVATGKNFGSKQSIGDLRTPEGTFTVSSIEDASNWSHDFKDDSLGVINNAYGPYFIRLNVPNQKGIGIHGTHDEKSIGSRASEGCIRMNNEDILKLISKIKINCVVVITPGIEDIKENYKEANTKSVESLPKENVVRTTTKPLSKKVMNKQNK